MSNTPHELAEEFPNDLEKISQMKATDAHFAKLLQQYIDVNRAVHRAETRVEVISPDAETELRRTRTHLKDHIAYHLAHGAAHG